MTDTNICTRCLLREMTDKNRPDIKKYQDAIKEEERAENEVYESRLLVCKSCDKLNTGTCMACGCYVELRAMSKRASCPKKKW